MSCSSPVGSLGSNRNDSQLRSVTQQHEILRGTLLNRLLDAVKQCQAHFGSKKELASDDHDARISCLLAQLEAVFCHGLRQNDSAFSSTLKHVTGILPGWNKDSSVSSIEDISLWCLVRSNLTSSEEERFTRLKNVTTDAGRARSWIRSCLNEKSLERHIETLLSNSNALQQFYEDWAFLRDPELSATLPQTARGLSTIVFSLPIDDYELNSTKGIPVETSDLLVEAARAPQPIMAVGQGNQKKDKRRRKPLVNVISFDGIRHRMSDTEGMAKVVKQMSTSAVPDNPESLDSLLKTWNGEESKQAKASTQSVASMDSIGSDPFRSNADTPADDTPLSRSSLTYGVEELPAPIIQGNGMSESSRPQLKRVQKNDNSREHDRLDSVGLEASEIDMCSRGSSYPTLLSQTDASEPFFVSSTNPAGDIDSVISKRCEDVASTSGEADRDRPPSALSGTESDLAKSRLSSQAEETIDELKAEVSLIKKRHLESINALQSKLDESLRENEVLKSQVKRYVEAVQLLKESRAVGNKTNTTAPEPTNPFEMNEDVESPPGSSADNPPPEFDDGSGTAAYERKLIQVAEMHAELMEFNDRLVRQLNRKNAQNRRIREELAALRGPLPDDFDYDDDSQSIASGQIERPGRPLVNIWIPTYFMTGKATDVHHVYQVYLRIKDSEWNIYRRYSDFKKLHERLKKQDNAIAAFKFPPKKSIGKKEKKFVEERRKQLEMYLRTTVNYVVQHFPEFSAVPVNRDTLAAQLGFFSDFAPAGTVSSRNK